jgi:hypothetical protein
MQAQRLEMMGQKACREMADEVMKYFETPGRVVGSM